MRLKDLLVTVVLPLVLFGLLVGGLAFSLKDRGTIYGILVSHTEQLARHEQLIAHTSTVQQQIWQQLLEVSDGIRRIEDRLKARNL